jgi:hypothetical protein
MLVLLPGRKQTCDQIHCFRLCIRQVLLYAYTDVPQVRGHSRTLLFGKTRKNITREKLLQIMCFRSQVLEYFTYDQLWRRYTPYIISSKKLRRCCHVDVTVRLSLRSSSFRSLVFPADLRLLHYRFANTPSFAVMSRGNIAVTFYYR